MLRSPSRMSPSLADLVAGDHAQRRGLAAARGPEQAAVAAGGDRQVDAVDGGGLAVALGDVDELELRIGGHAASVCKACATAPPGRSGWQDAGNAPWRVTNCTSTGISAGDSPGFGATTRAAHGRDTCGKVTISFEALYTGWADEAARDQPQHDRVDDGADRRGRPRRGRARHADRGGAAELRRAVDRGPSRRRVGGRRRGRAGARWAKPPAPMRTSLPASATPACTARASWRAGR